MSLGLFIKIQYFYLIENQQLLFEKLSADNHQLSFNLTAVMGINHLIAQYSTN